MTQSLPRRMKVKGVRGDKEVGVTCISYHHEDKDMFLVGSEAGVIFKCSMNSQGPPAGSKYCLENRIMKKYCKSGFIRKIIHYKVQFVIGTSFIRNLFAIQFVHTLAIMNKFQ